MPLADYSIFCEMLDRALVNGKTPVHMHGLLEFFSSHGEREEEARGRLRS